jgi:hypothetical protein
VHGEGRVVYVRRYVYKLRFYRCVYKLRFYIFLHGGGRGAGGEGGDMFINYVFTDVYTIYREEEGKLVLSTIVVIIKYFIKY